MITAKKMRHDDLNFDQRQALARLEDLARLVAQLRHTDVNRHHGLSVLHLESSVLSLAASYAPGLDGIVKMHLAPKAG